MELKAVSPGKAGRCSADAALGSWPDPRRYPEVIVLPVAVAVAYGLTMAPTVTWRNGGTDGAELAAAAYVWGVAHPPGYPIYLTLVRAFQLLPFGDLAYRATLFSGASGVIAAAVVHVATWRLVAARAPAWSARLGALFAAALFATSPLVWSQAVVPEVYTFGVALFAGMLLAFAEWEAWPERGRTIAVSVVLAALIGHQPTFGVLLLPLAVVAWRRRVPRHLWLIAGVVLLIAPLTLLTLTVRAHFQPVLNWGDPSTLARWYAHVTAVEYRAYFLGGSPGELLGRAPAAVSLLAWQLGWPAVALAGLGFGWLWWERRTVAVVAGGAAACFTLFAVLYNARDGEVYLLPTVQVLAVAAGIGLAWLLPSLASPLARAGVALALSLAVVWQVAVTWPEVDLSRDLTARAWGEKTLREAPRGAVLRSSADETTFVLWYLQFAEGLRPDVAIVETRLLGVPWYHAHLQARYPPLTDATLRSMDPVPPGRP